MATREWIYWVRESVVGAAPTRYYRRWRGVTERLDPDAWTWVPVDAIWFSRMIEKGEVGLDETTAAAVQAVFGRALPT